MQAPFMHRDPMLRRRNALAIPGLLLVLLCLAGMVYAQLVRSDDVECGDGRQVVFAGACRSASLLLAIPFAIGALMLGLGLAQRSKLTCRLGHGTGPTLVLAVLTAAFALPFLAAVGLHFAQDPDDPYVVPAYGVDFTLVRLLAGFATAMLLALVPYLGLYLVTARPPRCCRERECFEPCFCDEEPAPEPAPTFGDVTPAPAETAQVTTTAWPAPPPLPPPPLPPEPRPSPAPPPLPPPAPAAPVPAPEPLPWPAPEEPRKAAKAPSKAAKKSTRTVSRKSGK